MFWGFRKWDMQYEPVEEYYDENHLDDTTFLKEMYLFESDKKRIRRTKALSVIYTASLFIIAFIVGWFTRVGTERYLSKLAADGRPTYLNMKQLDFAAIPKRLGDISVQKVFHNNHTFDIERDDDESQNAWSAYFSRFISLDDDAVRAAKLPSSTRVRGRQMYSVAAYHQLHCVHVIRYGWAELKAKGLPVLEETYPGLESLAEGYTIEGHVSHCLDMIRQALECHADPTLEPMMKDDGITQEGTLASGWGGTPHLCRDFGALTEWVDAPEQHPIPSVEAFTSAFSGHNHSLEGTHHGDHHGGHHGDHGDHQLR